MISQNIKAIPRVIRRCRARGPREESHAAMQALAAATCGVPASIWWASIHRDLLNWIGVSVAVVLAVGVWAFALKQLYAEVKIVAAFGEQK
jgi:alpha-amylase/alpha-mannosidase (GH57 family)